MKKSRKRLVILSVVILFQAAVVYVGLAFYYHNAFEYGTWINGIYCTGKSIEEVNKELKNRFHYDGVTIYDEQKNSYSIDADAIGYEYDFTESLKGYLAGQNAWTWFTCFWRVRRDEIRPVVSYTEADFDMCFESLPIYQEEQRKTGNISIVKTGQGYELVNERMHVLDLQQAKEAIEEAVLTADDTIDLAEADCYYDMELTAEMQRTLQEWEEVKDFQDCNIIYQMGEDQIPIDASVVCDWIMLNEDGSFAWDEDGNLQLKEDAISEFISGLANTYDTVGISREFRATRGEVVKVEGGIYGNKLDQETEVEYLTDAFLTKKAEIHTPAYLQTSVLQGKDDIGSTYIEVDMSNQMMYYYKDGVLKVETPVVTGNTSRKMGTPSGVNYVYAKQTDRILRGEGYASHVNYWMPVKGNIGIHDATWRGKFGGQIYATNGSHGCINTPYSVMSTLYEMVEIGTPVVMFY